MEEKGERGEKWGKARRGFRRDATRVPRAQPKGCLEGETTKLLPNRSRSLDDVTGELVSPRSLGV